ncbi:hypothetical protein CFRA_06680 [Corynebacterium frankenforstense DSM 45800]|uniref:Uncharacterized protein n=1 Tax=Corynebacterium frankenforstense DSM 45800 TaxID=1437875 RepID=A0A1L7CT29_9CORY|nr:SpaH/EbpB family LPXTG-anchored major pilin [Corynebacterium frankenforstense]APT88987.1 hypothetical protein CFRA_06680 [Corynebacterium frankenforstense DSM 45800]
MFKVERVSDIDLTTAEGWLAAERLAKGGTDAVNDPTLKVETGVELTTGENGQATFENLPLGLYRVTETVAPEGHNRSTPFFVTVPMTNPQDRNAWMYNIHIYPKNQPFETEMTKTVVDANKNAGDDVDYTLTTTLPDYQKFGRFQIVDLFDANRLEANAESVTSVTAGGQPFTQGTDYTVAVQNETGRLYVIFTEAGRAKLDALKGDARKVQVKLSMKVKEIEGDETGPVDNSFTVIENPDGSPEDPDVPGEPPENPPEPEDKPKSYFGNVKIVKQDTGETGLQGAVFDVYRCNEAADGEKQKDNLEGGPIRKGVTTEANGEARVNGLHVNDFVDGKDGNRLLPG